VNWTINSVVVLPCFAFLLLEAARGFLRRCKHLRSRYVGRFHLTPVDPNIAIHDWQETLKRASIALAILLILAAIEPLIEWRQLRRGPRDRKIGCSPEKEFDWSVAALLRPRRLSEPRSKRVLLIVGISSPAVEIAAYAFFITLTFLFCIFFNQRRDAWQIVPVPAQDNARA